MTGFCRIKFSEIKQVSKAAATAISARIATGKICCFLIEIVSSKYLNFPWFGILKFELNSGHI